MKALEGIYLVALGLIGLFLHLFRRRWVPVEHRLPKIGQRVEFLVVGGTDRVGLYHGLTEYGPQFDETMGEATHWRRLPS